jgi:prepilin-type N-terminal cleavage/methylation domain-containing protein
VQRRAFTIIEILLAVSIIAVIGSLSIPSYRYYQIVSDLDRASNQVTHALYRSRQLALSNADDSAWGFRVADGVLFNGENFTDRNVLLDEEYALPAGITVSGLSEVSFSRIKGVPSATGSIVLTAVNGLQRVIAVIGEGGVIVKDPDGDKLTICHFSGGKGSPLKIAESAWPAHKQQHGDTLGPCPVSSDDAE